MQSTGITDGRLSAAFFVQQLLASTAVEFGGALACACNLQPKLKIMDPSAQPYAFFSAASEGTNDDALRCETR